MNTKETNKNAVILITNPLDARFVYGKDIESTVKQMRESTHIRILGNLIFKNKLLTYTYNRYY